MGFVARTHGGLPRSVFIGHRGSLGIGVEQQQRLEMPLDTFGSDVFPFGSDLGGGATPELAEVAELPNTDQAD